MRISSAYIEITNICNLDCQSCYNRSGKPHPKKELSFLQIKQIAKRLIEEFGCGNISLAGGEPTLHSEFNKTLAYLLSYPHLKVNVVTNGTTDCRSLIRLYHDHQHLKVQVSLDGSSEVINARTRRNSGGDISGHFNAAIATLAALRCQKKAPIMKMVISTANLQDVEAYYRLAVSMGCEPNFEFINAMGNATDVWSSLKLTAKQKLTVIYTLERLNKEYGKNIQLPFCVDTCPLKKEDSELSVLIKCDGSIQPCQMMYDSNYSLGNLLTDITSSIETGFARITTLAKERSLATTSCTRCVTRATCERGCMALAVMKSGDPLDDDGECSFRKLLTVGYKIMKYNN